jgi:hypothetical protein
MRSEARIQRPVWIAACAAAILFTFGSRTAAAQQLDLAFSEGRITVTARDVTARQILDEWARRGRTVVMNAGLLSDERVSLHLEDVVESKAIERILESAAGYVARRRSGTDGPSDFELILILAESDAPADIAAAVDGRGPLVSPAHADGDRPPPEAGAADSAGAPGDPTALSNVFNGRAPDAKPRPGELPEASVHAVPVEELPAGRPEGARPGTPTPGTSSPAIGVEPATSAAPAAGGAGAGEPVDANGRRPRPPGPPGR